MDFQQTPLRHLSGISDSERVDIQNVDWDRLGRETEVWQWKRFRTRAAYSTATTSVALLPGTTDREALGATWPLMNRLEGTRGKGPETESRASVKGLSAFRTPGLHWESDSFRRVGMDLISGDRLPAGSCPSRKRSPRAPVAFLWPFVRLQAVGAG